MRQFRPTRRLLIAALALAFVPPAAADDRSRHKGIDHERARAAVRDGRIRPLVEILAETQAKVRGDVVDVELKERRGALLYELTIVTPGGRVVEVEVDAASGRIVKIED